LKKKRFFAAWVVIEVVFAAFLLVGLYLGQNKTDLIIYYGIKTANNIVAAMIIASAAMLVLCFVLFFIMYVKKYRPVRQTKPEPAPAKPDVNSEEYIRGKLQYFLGIRPRLRGELTECLKQMDSVNEKQASLSEIRRRNSASCLRLVEDSLGVAELSVWNNLQAVLNIAEIWDPNEAGDPKWGPVYEKRRGSVQAYIKLNDDLIRESAILLTDGINLANDKTQSSEGARRELQASIETIAKLRDMSGVTEVK
jgi:hypothetical protein